MKSHLFAVIAAVLLTANSSPAAALYWSGDGSNEGGAGAWDTTNPRFGTSSGGPFSTVWNNAGSDNVTFEATVGAVTNSGITLNGTLTDDSGYTFYGTPLTIGPSTVFNVASGKTLTMSNVVAGLGGTLTKNGLGTFGQYAVNTYSNGTIINDGTWVIANAGGAFGTAGAGNILTINNVSEPVTFVRGPQSGETSPACPVVQNGDLVLGDGSAMALNVAFTMPVAYATWQIKGGNRKITTGANSAAGVWVIGATSTTAGHIIEDGTPRTLTFDGSGIVTINAENDITGGVIVNAGTVRIGGTIVKPFGPAALTLAGGGLSQAANHTGGAIVNAVNVTGSCFITTTATAASQVLEFSGNITQSAGTTLTLVDSAASGSFLPRFSGPGTFDGMISLNNNGGSGTATTTLNLFNTTGNDQTFADVISGSGALARSANSPGTGTAGTSYMNAANTFSGGTTLIDGAIGVGIDSSGVTPVTSGALGTGTITVNPSSSTCQPTLFASGGGWELNNAITLFTTTAPLIVNGNNTLTLKGALTGPGILSKSGTGQLRILAPPGGFNTYSGGTIIAQGSIACDSSSNGTDTGVNWGAVGKGTLTLAGGGISGLSAPNLRIIGNHILFAAAVATLGNPSDGTDMILSGNVDLGGFTPVITVDNNVRSTTISGQISNGGLTKAGPSPLSLTGVNIYTGPTTVSTGTLLVNSPGSLAAGSAVTVNSGATLGGTGTVNGSVTVSAGGSVSAGASPGILTVGGGLNLSAGGTNVWELGANSDANPGTDFDQILLTGGNLTLGGGSRLLIKFTGTATFPDAVTTFWQAPHSWTVIALSGSAVNPGPATFTSIDGVSTLSPSIGSFSTSVGSGGSIVLNYTPASTATAVTSFTITNGPGSSLTLGYSGGSGSRFVLLQTNNVAAPLSLWTRLQTNTSSPGTFTITPGADPQEFYRVKSE